MYGALSTSSREFPTPKSRIPIDPTKREAGPKSGFRDWLRVLEAVGHVRDADAVADDVLRYAVRVWGAAVIGGGNVPRNRARGDGDNAAEY